MPDEFPILPAIESKLAARVCPLLENEANGEEWVKCCTARFYPLAVRIAGDNSLAMDALQESRIKIFQAMRAHAYSGGPPACAWVRTIIANTIKDMQRKQVRRREVPLADRSRLMADPGKGPEELARLAEKMQLLQEIIAALPQTYREVLEMRYQRGLDTRETAELLHISRSSVTTRLSRAVRMIERRVLRLGGSLPPVPRPSRLGDQQSP